APGRAPAMQTAGPGAVASEALSPPSKAVSCSAPHAASAASRYERLESNIGEGTYGKVHKARDTRSGQIVAIKKAKVAAMDREVGGIGFTALREIKLMQAVRHPHLMACLDVFADGGVIHLVMEFMDGDLKKVIEDSSIHLAEAPLRAAILQGSGTQLGEYPALDGLLASASPRGVGGFWAVLRLAGARAAVRFATRERGLFRRRRAVERGAVPARAGLRFLGVAATPARALQDWEGSLLVGGRGLRIDFDALLTIVSDAQMLRVDFGPRLKVPRQVGALSVRIGARSACGGAAEERLVCRRGPPVPAQFLWAPAFGVAAQSAQGQTFELGVAVDVKTGGDKSPPASYAALARVLRREDMLIFRPFDIALAGDKSAGRKCMVRARGAGGPDCASGAGS
ncbi:unnamed protein product, partial [Prorocentrum cordatum]